MSMSDYQVGSDVYFLDRIDSTLEKTLEVITETKEITERLLDAFRELMNLESESIAYSRDLHKQRVDRQVNENNNEVLQTFVHAVALAKKWDVTNDYMKIADIRVLHEVESALERLRDMASKEITYRTKMEETTGIIAAQDAKTV